jgi:erythritol transport system ATP-binding protein
MEKRGTPREVQAGGSRVTAPADDIILEARAITRRYPGTIALDAVTYRVHRGQVNVLIGENGAGKSTLMHILAGVEEADEGELILDGGRIELHSPREASAQGIAIVHQELSVLPNLDIAENIFAGREPATAGVLVDRRIEDRRSADALRRLRKPMDVRCEAGRLALGCRQIVEVARAIDQGARILILDEPTSALSTAEAGSLFQVIAELKRSGVTIIYISHRLNELVHLGDRFTVLRSGRVVGTAPRSEVSRQWIVERMSRRATSEAATATAPDQETEVLLRAKGLALAASAADETAQTPLDDVNFTLRRGEILGIYGLLGSGRTELLEAIAGARRLLAGEIELHGTSLRSMGIADAVKAGIVLVPEDRQRDGLVPEMSIRENIALAAAGGGFFLNRAKETERCRQLIKELNIAAANIELPVETLSGGNQQKVLIARCLMRSPSILLLDEPTRGVDVGARAEIYSILRGLARRGLGIVFSSSEIEETQTLADRAIVLCQGRVAAEFERAGMTDQALFAAASPHVALSAAVSSGAVRL